MFSGIIEYKAKILDVKDGVFTIENKFNEKLNIGESIAHDGACMTVTEFNDEKYSFFAMKESFKKTNYSTKKVGDYFNVERSLKFGGKVDGHFVTGHIDTVGTVDKLIKNSDSSIDLYIKFDKNYNNLIINKGSISINGTSLTVVEVGDDFFSVSLIPLTQKITNLGNLKLGDKVNLEFDMIGKYIIKNIKNVGL